MIKDIFSINPIYFFIKDIIGGAILVCCLLLLPSAFAQSKIDYDTLLSAAYESGSVRVIVRLNLEETYQSERNLDTSKKLSQRQRISTAQDNFLSNYKRSFSDIKRFRTVPELALSVDAQGLERLKNDSRVIEIYRDELLHLNLNQSLPFIGAHNIHTAGHKGKGSVVAILDTGIRNSHEFLADKVVAEACFSTNYEPYKMTSICPNGQTSQIGTGAGINCNLSVDWASCSHGTAVAGVAAGSAANGLVGVAPDAKIISIQVFSQIEDLGTCQSVGKATAPCFLSNSSDQMLALEHIYLDLSDEYNIASINISVGGGRYSTYCDNSILTEIIENLRTKNIATVVAAGNGGSSEFINFPACISSAVAVGATLHSTDVIAAFSDFNQLVDMVAPGVDIFTAGGLTDDTYSSVRGTSFSAPHVAGSFALLRSISPNAPIDAIESAMKSTGVLVGRNGINKPRIDVAKAVDFLADGRDQYEVDDSWQNASEIQLGEVQYHNFHDISDKDWLVFNLEQDVSSVVVDAWDVEVNIYDANLNLLAYNYGYAKTGPLLAGTYYIETLDYSGFDTPYNYEISVFAEIHEDDYEYDNTIGYAAEIERGITQYHSIHEVGDIDWLRFMVAEDVRNVEIETSDIWFGNNAASNTTGTMVRLYNSDIRQISSSGGANRYSKIQVPQLSAGEYYIKVSEYQNNQSLVGYAIDLNYDEGPVGDAYEVDNKLSLAKAITKDESQNRSIHRIGDIDWATFTLDKVSDVRIETTGSIPTSGMMVRLYDSNNKQIRWNGGNGRYSQVVYPSLAQGTYYIKVTEYGNNAVLDAYTLSLKVIESSGDAYEVDNVRGNAKLISNGQTQRRSIHQKGDIDWLTFTLDQPATNVTIKTSGSLPTTGMMVRLYDSNNKQIRWNGGDGRYSQVIYPSLAAGSYYIKVTEFGNNAVLDEYALSLNYQDGPLGDEYEIDDTRGQAKVISNGQTQIRNIHKSGDIDWVKFTLNSRKNNVVIATSGTNTTSGTVMRLYNGTSNKPIAINGGANRYSRIVRPSLAAGTYYLMINEYGNNAKLSEYRLSLQHN